ncbi:fatty acid desaturase [Actibacterium sp. 188UL27-1]|uniref:fatty acid desaturase n=1 Tax=Actibacterium sp. 188UL27-1 TaxID=2786961 RepID=UPI00195BB1F3|nr:fatty acid desaturase [Actibacterium sp. 188UL27-1]MBM7069235.1 fatty acid desaturase [Actibacterium sp. 188UL27-1]
MTLARSGPATAWPTLCLIALCYLLWLGALWPLATLSPTFAVLVIAVSVAFHASLQHEVIHGHPTRLIWLNTALIAPALALVIPYLRFRDTHLAHHRDARLTDPYDDPESNFLDPAIWSGLPRGIQYILRANNTLAGRIVLGPVVGQVMFVLWDLRAIRAGNRAVLRGWLWHIPAALVVLALVGAAPLPVWAYLLGVYLGLGLLKIRSFLEHRAHDISRARSVIIEDRGPLALLFLNNNLHVVHHIHPGAAWYELPGIYAAGKDRFLRMNDGYIYRSYAEVVGRYLFRSKDPVPHPLMPADTTRQP